MTPHPHTSGDWLVKAGQEEAFVQQWTTFAKCSAADAAGSRSFHLIQDEKNPQHFISFGEWGNTAAIDAWRAMPEFQKFFSRCRELCETVKAGNFSLRAKGGAGD